MNRVYSILVRGEEKDSEQYQRKVDSTVGYTGLESVAELLVPINTDASYYNYQADQLVQICRKSLLNASLGAIDPFNTYEHTFDVVEPSTLIGSLPSGVSMDLLEPDMRHTWTHQVIALTINPIGLALVNGVPVQFTVTDDLTSEIELADGLSMRLRGSLPGSTFSTVLTATRQPHREIKPLVDALKTVEIEWLPDYLEYRHSLDINDWLAAFILNYCETVDGT